VKKEELVTEVVNRTFEQNFKFESGAMVKVQLSEANGNLKYVRIFNLIPEVEDVHIENALRELGQIKKHIREKFPASLDVDIYTGVRGIYIEMEKPLPPFMAIGNLRAKFSYHGMSEGCFNCNSMEHQKKDCPKKLTPFSRAQQQQQLQQQPSQHQQQQQQQQQLQTNVSTKNLPLLSEIVQNGLSPTIDNTTVDESFVSMKHCAVKLTSDNNQISQTNTTDDEEENISVDESEMEFEQATNETNGDMQRATRRDRKVKNKMRSGAAKSNNARVTRRVIKKAKNDIFELISKTNEQQPC
jgi:Zinc knuckle